jgi:rhamnosyltransferase
MINFPIAVVLYNPTANSINRILYYSDLGIQYFVFDNSNIKCNLLSNIKNITYYYNNKNYGLSYSLRFLSQNIKNNNFDNFLFFDQDTIYTIETLKYIDEFVKYKNTNDNHFINSILSVNFRDNYTKSNYLNTIDTINLDNYLMTEVFFTINSGSLFFLKHYNSFKWFDDIYFVDGVDYSFSLNVIINDFKNITIYNVPGLNHSSEQEDSTINIFGKRITSRVYPINRNYDFLRSHLFLLFKTISIKSVKPKLFLIKEIFNYIILQFIFRLISFFNK